MGCSSSAQTTAQDTTRPSIKAEESNGASSTGAANENRTVAEDSETIPDQTKPVGLLPAATDSAAASRSLAVVEGAPDTTTPSPTPAPAAEVSDETEPPTDSTTATVQRASSVETPAAHEQEPGNAEALATQSELKTEDVAPIE